MKDVLTRDCTHDVPGLVPHEHLQGAGRRLLAKKHITVTELDHEKPWRASRATTLVLAAIPLAATQVFAAQSTPSWVGAANGDYANPANWDIGQVPLHAGASSFIASTGSGKNVTYGVTSPKRVDPLLLDVNSS